MSSFDSMIRIKHELLRFMVSEFFGTFILVFVAHSTGSAYGFKSVGDGSDTVAKVMGVTFGVGCAALIALTCAMPISGGHINPAITVAVASMGHFPWSRVIPYLIAQHLGGFAAAASIYLTFRDPILHELADSMEKNNSTLLGYKHTAHLFCSGAAKHATPFGSFMGSFWATAIFLIGIAGILEARSQMKPPKWYWPLGCSFVLMVSLAAFGHNGGPSVNPAADFTPRVFASLMGWNEVMWGEQGGMYWWIAGFVGPHLGGAFGLWFYRIFMGAHYPDVEEEFGARDRLEMERLNKS